MSGRRQIAAEDKRAYHIFRKFSVTHSKYVKDNMSTSLSYNSVSHNLTACPCAQHRRVAEGIAWQGNSYGINLMRAESRRRE